MIRRVKPVLLTLFSAGALASLGTLAGCYERVVRAEGYGADRINTSEGRSNTEADRWFDENVLGRTPDKTGRFDLSAPPTTSGD